MICFSQEMSRDVGRSERHGRICRRGEELFKLYENIPPPTCIGQSLHLIPTVPAAFSTSGQEPGATPAWFAAMGQRVVAVEPTDAMRIRPWRCIRRR